MNNYKQIQAQWSDEDMAKYPHLFDWTARMMEEGLKAGEKVN